MDPFNPAYHLVMSLVEYTRGNGKLALERIRSAYKKNPEVPQVLLYYAYLLAANNYASESSAVFDRLVAENTGTIFCPMGTFLKHSLQGEKDKALESLSEESKTKLRKDPEWSWLIADGYAMIHQTDESLEWLEAMVSTDFINYPLLSKYDVFLDNVRSEPRFTKLMEKVKFSWGHFDS